MLSGPWSLAMVKLDVLVLFLIFNGNISNAPRCSRLTLPWGVWHLRTYSYNSDVFNKLTLNCLNEFSAVGGNHIIFLHLWILFLNKHIKICEAIYLGSPLHSRNKPYFFMVLLVFADILHGVSAALSIDELVHCILCRITFAGSVAGLRSPDICRWPALGRGEGCVSV